MGRSPDQSMTNDQDPICPRCFEAGERAHGCARCFQLFIDEEVARKHRQIRKDIALMVPLLILLGITARILPKTGSIFPLFT